MHSFFSNRTALFAMACIIAACNNDFETVAPPIVTHANLYAKLDVNHHAVLLSITAPYDTVQLITTPLDVDGNEWQPVNTTVSERDSILRLSPPAFISQDSSRVRVTRDGLIHAVRSTGTGTVRIISMRQLANVTRADTTLVRVTDMPSPPKIAIFRLRPADSTKVASGSSLPIALMALDTGGNSITNVVTYLRSTNTKAIAFDVSGVGTGWNSSAVVGGGAGQPGSAHIVSEAYVYGIRMTDTVLIKNGYPISGNFSYHSETKPDSSIELTAGRTYMQVGPGAVIGWENSTKFQEITIVFEDSTVALPVEVPGKNSGEGNILNIPYDSTLSIALRTRYRRFLRPGRYTFKILPGGNSGTIIVREY